MQIFRQLSQTARHLARPVAGVILTAAAVLNLAPNVIGGGTSVDFFTLSRLTVAAGAVELAVGLWLCVGWWRRPSLATAALLFAAFGAVSLAKGVAGEADCGCFGQISMSPWVTFGLDALLTAGLVVAFLNAPESQPEAVGSLYRWLRVSVAAAVVAGCGLLVAVSEYGPISMWFAAGRPAGVSAEPVDVGSRAGGRVEAITRVRNVTRRAVRLVGSQASCSCVKMTEVPADIPAGGEATVRLSVSLDGPPRRISERILLFTDCPESPRLRISVSGRVLALSAHGGSVP